MRCFHKNTIYGALGRSQTSLNQPRQTQCSKITVTAPSTLSYIGIVATKQTDSQFLKLLAKLPGVWSNDANSILADPQDTKHAQAIQPTFVNLCQVVVLQLPGGGGDIIDKNNCIKSIYCFNISAGGTIGENILWKIFFQQDFFIGAAHFLLNILPKSKRLHSQFFNVVQSKKGSIHELSDAIPLHLQ